ncbi:MAG: hypothetical protein KBG82_05205 [Spirochaetes bacterium]|nr:hypothetical protein [Spirochaetota bacterium]
MKKKASCLLIIIMIFFSLLSFSDESCPEESTFAFHGEEFFCINKAEDFKNSDIKGADFKIPSENSGVQYRYTRMKNEKIHSHYKHYDSYRSYYKILYYYEYTFNNIETFAIYSKSHDGHEVCLDLYGKETLNWLFHCVKHFDTKTKKFLFYQLTEYNYPENKMYNYMINPGNSNKRKLEVCQIPGCTDLRKNIYSFNFDYSTIDKFAFFKNIYSYIKNNGNMFVRIPGVDEYYKIKLVEREIQSVVINNKPIETIYYLFHVDFPFSSVLIDNKRNYFELYLSNDNLKKIIKSNLVFDINNDLYQYNIQYSGLADENNKLYNIFR